MISTGKKAIGLFAAVVVVGSGVFILCTELASVKKAETYSSVVSVWHELTHGDVLGQAGTPITSEWRILVPSEHQTVMVELEKRHLLDKGAGKLDAGGVLCDPWGVPIKIAVRSNSQSTNDVVVWSAGSDGKSGTLDDICYPQEGLHDIPSDLVTRSKFDFDAFVITKTGLLILKGRTNEFLLVPQARYPGELRSVMAIDFRDEVYVARFGEPGGVGVEGFYDVCFQIKGGKVLMHLFELGGSLERVSDQVFVRSSAYVYDRVDKRVFMVKYGEPVVPLPVAMTNMLSPFTSNE